MFTSDRKGAGTDATVSCRLHGVDSDGGAVSTPRTKLSSSADNFERNRRDSFAVRGPVMYELEAIEIGHDDAGLFADWHLQHVEVTNSRADPERALPLPAERTCCISAVLRQITMYATVQDDGTPL